MNTPKKQQGPFWKDETGIEIPVGRVTKAEKLKEQRAFIIARDAIKISQQLAALKSFVQATCAEIVDAVRAENGIKTDSKGNFTWYNFDRSTKVEVNVNEAIRFDETLIDGAKDKLLKLIADNISGDDFIKAIVADAFQTTAGKLDTRRVLGLKRHTNRIKNAVIKAEWEDAMSLIDKAITRPESRTYTRVLLRNAAGDYENIDLNFSSIKAGV